MAWTKIPAANFDVYRAALPRDPRVTTIAMFGGLASLVHGNMFGGLFARSMLVKLGPDAHREALALDGSVPFDPLGTGRVMTNTVLLSEEVMEDPAEMRRWLQRAFDHVVTLPPKVKRAKATTPARQTASRVPKQRVATPRTRQPATRPIAKKTAKKSAEKAAKRPAAKPVAAKQPAEKAARRPAAKPVAAKQPVGANKPAAKRATRHRSDRV